jgi:hypothetical protein
MNTISDDIYEHTITWESFKGHKLIQPLPIYINTLLDWRLNLMHKITIAPPDKIIQLQFEIEATDKLLDYCNNL